jgi:hypothetical protein
VRNINHERMMGASTTGPMKIVEEGLDKSDLRRAA